MTTHDRILLQPERRGYDNETDTYHAHHDWTGPDSLCYSVCTAVAAITGDDVSTTSVVGEEVDFDALDGLFRTRQRAGRPADHVTVTYDECRVTIYRTGHIAIRAAGSEL